MLKAKKTCKELRKFYDNENSLPRICCFFKDHLQVYSSPVCSLNYAYVEKLFNSCTSTHFVLILLGLFGSVVNPKLDSYLFILRFLSFI